jgi:hypothetical protein
MHEPNETAAALASYFDEAIRRIREHPTYAGQMQAAAQAQEQLVLNYHTHGPGHGYCASICVDEPGIGALRLGGGLRELVHLRGVGREKEDCEPLMDAFASALVRHYRLDRRPLTWLDGAPRPESGA